MGDGRGCKKSGYFLAHVSHILTPPREGGDAHAEVQLHGLPASGRQPDQLPEPLAGALGDLGDASLLGMVTDLSREPGGGAAKFES